VSEPDEPREPRSLSVRLIVPLLIVVALGAAVAWWLRPPVEHRQAPAPGPVPKPAVQEAPTPSEPATPPTPSAPKSARAKEKPAPATTPLPVAAPGPSLHVSSDVDGAHVFVDRRYVGNTPLDTSEVTAGRHQVNVSADGYDGASESVNVAESGSTDLHVSLKTVRLDASVPVVHKHAMGSCEGTLRADPDGLRYETTNTADAFSLPLSDLDVFSTDYAQKTLKVKKRGGKTWNFTTNAPNADPLLSFQQAVDHARQKLGLTR
jgi:PEGA domain